MVAREFTRRVETRVARADLCPVTDRLRRGDGG
jgi:hypothetical protein